MRMTRFRSFLTLLVLIAIGLQSANACTIPVFRYALDKWHPDPYGIHVNESWLETEAGRKFAKEVGELSHLLQVVPGEEKEGEVALLQPAPGSPEIWRGKTDVEAIRKLLISPARKQVVEGIVNGSSAVWVLVLTGDEKVDSKFEEALAKRLKYLEEVATIPPQDPFDPENKLGPGPELKVGFTLVKVDRNAEAEQLLIRMLAGRDAEELIDGKEPFAAPVFGRGRALGAWRASDLDDEGIDELSLFLLGACSCQVKAQNPGWDLLIHTDWDEKLMKVAMELERAEPEMADMKPDRPDRGEAAEVEAPKEPEVVKFGADPEPVVEAPAPASPGPAANMPRAGFVVGLGLLVVLIGFFAWRSGM